MKKIFYVLCILIIFITVMFFINNLVSPKYVDTLVEGSLTSDYYKSNKDHEVIILGDCEVYSDISPDVMYLATGVSAYNRANSQQMLWQSYYMLEETLQYETPKVVMLSVGAMRNGEDMINEAYNRLAIDKMKWSSTKVSMINASMGDDENFIDYVLPILRYHTRISELTSEDFKYLVSDKKVSYRGYLLNTDVVPLENVPVKRSAYYFDDKNIEYLDKIVELCKSRNIEIVLFKSPAAYPYWYDEWDQWFESYANDNEIPYYNYNNLAVGIDYATDSYDGGTHLNYYGAKKLSTYIAYQLDTMYNLTDKKGDPSNQKLYFEFETALAEAEK